MQVTQPFSTDVQRRIFSPLPTEKYRSATHWYLSFFWRSPGLVLLSLGISLVSVFLTLFPSILLGQAFSILQSEGFSQTFLFICLELLSA